VRNLAARCARAVQERLSLERPQVHRITQHSLRNGFNRLFRALPGDEFVLSPSSADAARDLDVRTEARLDKSGSQSSADRILEHVSALGRMTVRRAPPGPQQGSWSDEPEEPEGTRRAC
jgi:hypothetical protein